MKSKSENLELTIGLQKEEIKLYLTIIKEIFNALNSIRIYSIKEILTILSKDINNADNQKIKKEIGLIERIFDEICLLLKAKERENIKKNIMDFKDSIMEYEYYQNYDLDIYIDQSVEEWEKDEEEFNRKIEKEFTKNKNKYGKEYAHFNISQKMKERYGRTEHMHPGFLPINDTIKKKNYTKFYIKAYNPTFEAEKVSKRNLPTQVFKYLFVNGFLDDNDIATYSTNQFGRTFETKRGDILTENEMIDNQKNLHRYNKIDFSKINNSKYNKTLYISNQWDYDSIKNFIEHINEKFKGIIFSDEENYKKLNNSNRI